MPKSRRRTPPKKVQPKTVPTERGIMHSPVKLALAIASGIGLVIGLISGAVALLPRAQIDAAEQFESGSPFPTSVTLIDLAPSMTWLFVRTSPFELSTIPVPAAVVFW